MTTMTAHLLLLLLLLPPRVLTPLLPSMHAGCRDAAEK